MFRKISSFAFLLYPVAVVAIIAGSLNMVLSPGDSAVYKLLKQREDTAELREKETALKAKLEVLAGVDLKAEQENLTKLLEGVPSAKKIWLLGAQIQAAATAAAEEIDKYLGSGGQVKEASVSAISQDVALRVEYALKDFGSLRNILDDLHNYLPMAKIRSVKFDNVQETVTVDVEGAFGDWTPIALENQYEPLPEYKAAVSKALAGIADLVKLPELVVASDEAEIVNPF